MGLPSMPSALPIIADFSQAIQLAFCKSLKANRYTLIKQSNILLKQSGLKVDIITLASYYIIAGLYHVNGTGNSVYLKQRFRGE